MRHIVWYSAVLPVLAFFLIALSCMHVNGAGDAEDFVSGTGRIVFVDLEGGFFGIISDDGRRFDPMNLEKEFQVSGLRVRFEGRTRTDVLGFRMWGTPFKVLKIESLADQGS